MTLSEDFPDEMLPVRAIPLTQGQVTIIDPEDYEKVSSFKLCVAKRNRCWYVTTSSRTYLHKYLTGFPRTDHHNNDGLDNRRVNLRKATQSQNTANSRKHLDGITPFKGVSCHQNTRKWRAYIWDGTKQIHLGYFDKDTDAAHAYDEAAIHLHGEYAKTNKDLGLL
jgi:hypothetical protein